ncbi:hypothetical protein FPCIR_11431 [Fusarium pseudocircinatum]|uniref:Uncharacterized protein n=1 Tax=Fusarium pseudocircinatum TaxID=56676 RepID=A0A8H5KT86_9HYPO|nr:hypothetical protein FPCIR_11431 [Fusarium pseudocircinatum]
MMFNSLVTGSRAPRNNFNSERPLRLSLDEVTSEWLSEALGVAVKDFNISSTIHGTSSKVFADLAFGDGAETENPSRVVLKGGDSIPQLFGKDGSKLENPIQNIRLALPEPTSWGARFDEKIRPPVAKGLLDPDLIRKATGALAVEDRRKHGASLIDAYFEALHREGGPKLRREDLWDDYRRYSLQGFLWAMTPQTMQPNEVVFAMEERYST